MAKKPMSETISAKSERVQKILSAHGVASRREAEKMIQAGRVTVNGVQAVLGQTALVGVDEIEVDRKPLPCSGKAYYIMLNKPCGYITSLSDERGRNTVTELVAEISDKARIYPVGRLDMDSEGLLLMTNDGMFANIVMHPKFGLEKTYEIHVRGDIITAQTKLAQPIEVDSRMVKASSVKLLKQATNGGIVEVIINEGRNRQVRKMCSASGLEVLSLKRVAIGKLRLGNLPLGKWRHLTENELRSFSELRIEN
jgi:23S rRNA pseudouridine2605 synthase